MLDTEMLIGANFVAGADAPEPIVNPKTEEVIANLPDASAAQVDAAVSAADKAFKSWSRTTPGERSALLLKLADAIERDAESYSTLEALNTGKPRIRVLQDEMPAIVDCFRFFAGAVRSMHGPVAGEYLAGHTSMIRRDPVGVVGSIAPWNYPLMMAAWKLAPALAGGNTIVLEAVRADAAYPAEAGKDARRHIPGRRREHRRRQRRDHRLGADQSSQSRDGVADRQHRHRPEGAAGRFRNHQAHASRARRQGAGHRLRRCGHRLRRLGHQDLRLSTTPGRIARPRAGSTPARRSTTTSLPTCRARSRS